MTDVLRTGLLATDVSRSEEFDREYKRVFKGHHLVATTGEIKPLVDLGMLIEIETDAMFRE